MPGQYTNLTVGSRSMPVYVAQPAGNGPHPAVLVAMHGGGVEGFIQDICDRLAAEGYVAAAPDLFHRLPPTPALSPTDPNFRPQMMSRVQSLRDTEVIEDFNAATAYVRGMRNVAPNAVGITGFCMGGRVVWLMASVNPAFKAVAPFYGGSIMNPWGEPPTPFDRTAGIAGPVLFFFGNDDQNPSPADRQKLDAELTRLGKPHTFVPYDGTGHGFMNPGPAYREAAAKDAWPKLINFFNQHLKVREPARA